MPKLLNFQKNTPRQDAPVIQEVSKKEIAIIGIAVRYPKAEDTEAFWRNLTLGIDCAGDLPDARKKDIESYLRFHGQWSEETKYFKGSYLDEIDDFDYKYFGLTPKEAELMDPNQRLFLQTAWKALEDAGYGGQKLAGTKTGVIISGESRKGLYYQQMVQEIEPESLTHSLPGNSVTMIPSRVSYLLDMHGPAIMVDTACSSALGSIHLASRMLRDGEIDLAIAGGVKINLLPVDADYRIGIESSDGRTKSFSNSSDGTTIGEGVAALLLKPLSEARRDNDRIYAVIKGSAMNHDGRSIGVTAPNMLAQEEVIVSAWQDAGIEPERLSYIEAHGTGTPLGDPIEIAGLTRAFRRYTDKKQFCAIGSVKSNLSHTDNLAGVTGLIKAVLSLKNKQIPASLNFHEPNQKIPFEDSPVYVNDTLTDWESDGAPRLCGVSAFGMSGTNCHVVLEEAPAEETAGADQQGTQLFTLSAVSEGALRRSMREYLEDLAAGGKRLADICYTASTGRGHYQHRLAVLAEDLAELSGVLARLDREGLQTADGVRAFYNGQAKPFESAEAAQASLSELARLYTEGADLDWDRLYERAAVRKVNLPTYPFEKSRCWLQIPEGAQTAVLSAELSQVHQEILEFLQSQGANEQRDRWMQVLQDSLPKEKVEARKEIRLVGKPEHEITAKERDIAKAWGKVLGVAELHLHDDFFDLGGDSFIAVQLVSQLNKNYQVALNDIFIHRSVSTLAEHIPERPENIKNKLQKLKKTANHAHELRMENKGYIESEREVYRQKLSNYQQLDIEEIKPYQHLFLTGATGFLGIYLLADLLKETDSTVHVLVRGKTNADAQARLADKWQHYFGSDLRQQAGDRVQIVNGDLTQDRFGLPQEAYDRLAEQVECVIHSAASVKHFGDYEEFYELNVRGTERVVEFAKQGRRKDVNLISSTAVVAGRVEGHDFVTFSEFQHDIGQSIGNPYGKSKMEAERIVIEARDAGLACNIFRVGNIMFHSESGLFQENIETNGLYTIIRSMIKMQVFPDIRRGEIDFSYIDTVSRSICLLFNRAQLENETYHICNSQRSSLYEVAQGVRAYGFPVEITSFDAFLDFMGDNYSAEELAPSIHNLLLHFGFYDYLESGGGTHFHMFTEKTDLLLGKLGIEWAKPTEEQLKKMLAYCSEVQFV